MAARCWNCSRAETWPGPPAAGIFELTREADVSKVLSGLGAFIGGTVGWWIGGHIGIMTAFFASIIATGFGIYAGRRIAREYLE